MQKLNEFFISCIPVYLIYKNRIHTFKLVAFIALFMGWSSCTSDEDHSNVFQWNDSKQQEEYRPVDTGKASSYFAIDDNIISFAVPNLVGTKVVKYLTETDLVSPDGFRHYKLCAIILIMSKGTDVTKLAPVITLTPGATITCIHPRNEQTPSQQVDYIGIAKVGEYNFRHQVDFTVIAPDGSTVTYMCLAVAIGDVLSCANCL